MATNLDFVEYVCEQIAGTGVITYRKMFGEYMAYIDGKPILLICDNQVFVKILPETASILEEKCQKGFPYDKAKLHYVIDADNKQILVKACNILKQITPLPQKKINK